MHIHFIAIGGSAMHNLALALSQKGEKITGSDDAIFEPSKSRLEKAGLLPAQLGWFPDKISKNVDAVILGMHAKKDNPELLKARELDIPIYSYPAFLYQQSTDKKRVVIGGSHGKTTITAMILHVLHFLKKEVDFMVGAQLEGFDTMVHLTKENDFIVLEGDEYLSSPIDRRPKFHLYKPDIALLSGIAWDHINVFPTYENYVHQFEEFLKTMNPEGTIVYNADDVEVKRVVEKAEVPRHKIAYQLPKYRIVEGKSILETVYGDVKLEVFGNHNLSNISGAMAVCEQMGIDKKDFYRAIASFKGASKRLEKIAENENTIVFKDFAHSPSKVKATTQAVARQFENKKLLACFELHTYSSLNAAFLNHYKNTLDAADEAVVFYSPQAVKIKGLEPIGEDDIYAAFADKNLKVFVDPAEFKTYLQSKKLKNYVVLLMSSGNYGGLDFDELKQWI